jgi:hypothetical protein
VDVKSGCEEKMRGEDVKRSKKMEGRKYWKERSEK